MCGPNAVLLNLNICVAFEEIVDVVLLSSVLRCCAVMLYCTSTITEIGPKIQSWSLFRISFPALTFGWLLVFNVIREAAGFSHSLPRHVCQGRK